MEALGQRDISKGKGCIAFPRESALRPFEEDFQLEISSFRHFKENFLMESLVKQTHSREIRDSFPRKKRYGIFMRMYNHNIKRGKGNELSRHGEIVKEEEI